MRKNLLSYVRLAVIVPVVALLLGILIGRASADECNPEELSKNSKESLVTCSDRTWASYYPSCEKTHAISADAVLFYENRFTPSNHALFDVTRSYCSECNNDAFCAYKKMLEDFKKEVALIKSNHIEP